MTCTETLPLLELELDGELDARSVLEVRDHLARCAACGRQMASLRALGEAARAHLVSFELPSGLERRLPGFSRSRRPRILWAAGALAAAAAVAIYAVPRRGDALLDEAVAAHARSLQLDHAIDVQSGDQHTVKPWFEGKVGFAVPVRDYAASGFQLAGGRLDYLDGRPAAALVYRRGKHLINLFVLDARGAGDAPPRREDLRGFACWRWTSAGLRYLLVGDVSEPEMGALAREIAGQRP